MCLKSSYGSQFCKRDIYLSSSDELHYEAISPVMGDDTEQSRKRHGQSRSASERGYGHPWREIVERITQRDMELGQPCLDQSRTTQMHAVDHIVNKAIADADGVVVTASGQTMHSDDPDYLQSNRVLLVADLGSKGAGGA